MSIDARVMWVQQRPSFERVGQVLEDFVGEAGKVSLHEQIWICDLLGQSSFPFRRIFENALHCIAPEPGRAERFFEVWYREDGMTITTREADEFTNVIARGFANLCARFWEAKLDAE